MSELVGNPKDRFSRQCSVVKSLAVTGRDGPGGHMVGLTSINFNSTFQRDHLTNINGLGLTSIIDIGG